MKHTDIIHISFSPDGEFISFWTRSDVRLAQYRLAHPESPIATFRAVKESLTVESVAAQVPQEWRDVMAELAADLQAAIDHEYKGTLNYPSRKKMYDNDMATVERARALLQEVKP